jgi:hypothetical protein
MLLLQVALILFKKIQQERRGLNCFEGHRFDLRRWGIAETGAVMPLNYHYAYRSIQYFIWYKINTVEERTWIPGFIFTQIPRKPDKSFNKQNPGYN